MTIKLAAEPTREQRLAYYESYLITLFLLKSSEQPEDEDIRTCEKKIAHKRLQRLRPIWEGIFPSSPILEAQKDSA